MIHILINTQVGFFLKVIDYDTVTPHLLISFHVDITVELAVKDDCYLAEVDQFILEIRIDDQVVDSVSLVSRESEPGVWDASQRLILYEFSLFELPKNQY
jgi:hypothetical protein